MYNYFFIQQMFKMKLACQDGVTEIDDTKSRLKFLLVVFSVVFKVVVFSRLFGTKLGDVILNVGSFEALLAFFWMSLLK